MRKLLNYTSIFISLIVIFFTCSCYTQIECIDPDDWGGRLSTNVSSNGGDGTNITTITQYESEIIDWKKSYELDGNRVVMIIKNRNDLKTSDLNCSEDPYNNKLFSETNSWLPILSNYIDDLTPQICKFVESTPVTTEWCPVGSSMDTDNIPALNLPCNFTYGLGLYSTLATTTPKNTDFSCLIDGVDPNNCFFHIGDNMGNSIKDSTFYSQSCPTAGVSFDPPSSSSTINIYFKILDRYYSDNSGSYTVEFKQGVKKSGTGGIVTRFVGMVQALLCNVTTGIFNTLVKETDFIGYIRVILVLYIVILGISSVTGFSQLTHKELLIKGLKFAVVVQLISPTSWEFFNDYFFKLFTNGIAEIIGIVFGQSSDIAPVEVNIPWINSSQSEACNFQALAGFSAIDDVINQLFSYETTRKIFSLLFGAAFGFVYIPIIYICMGVVLFTLIKFVLIYLVSFLIISLLITLAPIFIPLFLFRITRSFFNNWLQTLISYFVQPIIILTFAFFLLQIFMSQMQSMLGYRICWKHLLTIPIVNIKFYAWQYDFDNSMGCITTPNAIYTDGSSSGNDADTSSAVDDSKSKDQLNFVGDLNIESYPGANFCTTQNTSTINDLCTEYTCSQTRFIGYPYLNPYFSKDIPRIKELNPKFNSENPTYTATAENVSSPSPTLVSFKDIVVFAMIIWFMHHFSKIVPLIAKQVAKGNPFSGVDLGEASGALQGTIFKFSTKAATLIGSPIYKKVTKGRSLKDDLRTTRQTIKGLKEYVQDKLGNTIENTGNTISNIKITPEIKLPYGPKIPRLSVGTVAKLAFAPHKLVGEKLKKGVEKIGQKTLGKAKEKIGEKWKEARKTISDTMEEKLLGKKHPENISDKAKKSLQEADDALSRALNKRKEKKAARIKMQEAQELLDKEKTKNVEETKKLIEEKKKEQIEAQKLIQENTQEAFKKYSDAAKEGSTKAMISLGNMYEGDQAHDKKDINSLPEIRVFNNLSTAHKLYTQALNKGDQYARLEINRISQKIDKQTQILQEKGRESLKNGDEAFSKALDQKNKRINSQDNLERAYKEYNKSAQYGNTDGMMALGNMYEKHQIGNNTEITGLAPKQASHENLSKAHELYTQAYKAGHQLARQDIDRVSQQMQEQQKFLKKE